MFGKSIFTAFALAIGLSAASAGSASAGQLDYASQTATDRAPLVEVGYKHKFKKHYGFKRHHGFKKHYGAKKYYGKKHHKNRYGYKKYRGHGGKHYGFRRHGFVKFGGHRSFGFKFH